MGKSKAFLRSSIVRASTNNQSSLSKVKGNPFDCLEVEEPFDFVPFLKLPRELRDQIYDIVTEDVVAVTGEGVGTKLCLWDEPAGQVDHKWQYPSTSTAMLFLNHQIHSEILERFEGRVTHQHILPIDCYIDPETVELYLLAKKAMASTLSINARSLSIKIVINHDEWLDIPQDLFQNLFVSTPVFNDLAEALLKCHCASNLVLEWSEAGHGLYLGLECTLLMDSMLQIFQALPNLLRYSVKVGDAQSYASRESIYVSWADNAVVRFTHEHMERPMGEWEELLECVCCCDLTE